MYDFVFPLPFRRDRQQCDVLLSADDSHTIRGSLFRLIKFYVEKDLTSDEAQQLMAFICSVREEYLVSMF